MKIALCITKSNWGGAQKYVFDLAVNLAGRGHDVVVMAGEEQSADEKQNIPAGSAIIPEIPQKTESGELFQRLKEKNIRTIVLKNSQRDFSLIKEIKLLVELNKIFKEEKPEVVHINSSKIGAIGSAIAHFRNVYRIVFTAHGWAFNEMRPSWQTSIIKFISWLTIIFSDRVVCLSKTEYNQAVSWPFCGKKLVVIPLGINPPEFLDKDTARNQLGITDFVSNSPSNILGTIAELHPNKGLAFMIEAMQQLPSHKWIVIGDGQLKQKFNYEIQSRGLTERVKFLGAVKDASKYIKAFDIFILPSVKEGLPYTIIESGYGQLPVISTTVGGIPDLVNKFAILVKPADSQALEQAIKTLDSEQKRQELATGLLNIVQNTNNLKMMIDSTEAVYR